jgi:hypothetical protein
MKWCSSCVGRSLHRPAWCALLLLCGTLLRASAFSLANPFSHPSFQPINAPPSQFLEQRSSCFYTRTTRSQKTPKISLHLFNVGSEQQVQEIQQQQAQIPVQVVYDPTAVEMEKVPTKMSEAVRVFFFSGDFGPFYVGVSLLMFALWRLDLQSFQLLDGVVFGAAVVFWWFQEHILHQRFLHSKLNWRGKDIHQTHHDKPYYHISIDPAGLLLGWMLTVHVLLLCLLLRSSLPLALSATLGYSSAGLFYEWAHYIVHTKVRLKSPFWNTVKDNHIRHHLVNHHYWFGFSLPLIDDLFQTNPSVADARRRRNMGNDES